MLRLFRYSLLTLVLGLSLFSARSQGNSASGDGPSTIDPQLRSTVFFDGVRYFLFSRYDLALQSFGSLEKLMGDYAPALYYSSLCSYRTGDTLSALRSIDRALALDTTQVDYWCSKAQMQLSCNDLTSAIPTLEHIYRVAPERRDYHLFLARVLLSQPQGDSVSLSRGFDLATEYESKFGYDPDLTSLKNLYFFNTRQLDKLLLYSNSIVASDSSSANLINHSRVLASTGRHQQAQAILDRVVARDSLDYSVLASVSDYWRLVGDSQRFISTLRPLLLDSLISSQSKVDIVTTYFQMGGDASSEGLSELLRGASSCTPDSVFDSFYSEYLCFTEDFTGASSFLDSLVQRGRYSLRQGLVLTSLYLQDNPSRAKSLSDSLLVRFSDSPEIHSIYPMAVYLHNLSGDFRGSRALCSQMFDRATTDSVRSVSFQLLSEVADIQGRSSQKNKYLRRSIELDSTNHLALNNYSYSLSNSHPGDSARLQEALALSVRANELSSGNSSYIDTQAWILYRLGRFDEARQKILYLMGIEKEPSLEVLLHASAIMEAVGDTASSQRYLKMAQQVELDKQEE